MSQHIVYPEHVSTKSFSDSGNSTIIPLTSNATFTGVAVRVSDFSTINVSVKSDVASATSGLKFQFSPDGTNWDHEHAFDYDANENLSYNMSVEMRFFRIQYVNGSSAQSTFRLTTTLYKNYIPPSEYTVEQAVGPHTLAAVTKSVIYGKTTAGGSSYVSVKVDPSGALAVAPSQTAMEIVSVNSSTATLANGATFTGTWHDLTGWNTVPAAVKTDQPGVMYIDFSPDGTNADSSLSYNVEAATNEIHRLTVTRRYFRVRFTNNSGSAQTYFRLQSLKGNQHLLTSNLNSTITDDADAITSRSVLYGRLDNGRYKAVNVSQKGHLEAELHGPLLPFGAIHVEKLTPVFQSDGVYGLNSTLQDYQSTLSGSVTSSDGQFVVSTGTTVGSMASLQSRKRLRYRPGQGAVTKFTALFTTPVANSYQVAGVGTAEDTLAFGYKDTQFGILRTHHGVREVQTLTITTASSTNENITVTLGGVAFSVAVTNSANIQRTVYEISRGTYTGWRAAPSGSTVVFLANSVGNKTGTFSITATTAVGTFSETKAGSNATEYFYPQTEWTGDVCDGTGSVDNPSGFLLDPTKGNVYQIMIQYLGYGPLLFEIEIPSGNNNPQFYTVHSIELNNAQGIPTLGNPSFPFLLAAYSAGSTTDLTVKSASYSGFIEGDKKLHGTRASYVNSLTTVGSLNLQALFTIRNKLVYKTKTNQSVINIMDVTGAIKHTSPVIFYIIKNGTLSGNPNFKDYATDSCSSYDTSATTVTYSTNDQLLWTGHLGDTGELDHSFANTDSEELTIQPGEYITLAARATTGSPAWVTGSINTREDQ